jgi:hypothetical protein
MEGDAKECERVRKGSLCNGMHLHFLASENGIYETVRFPRKLGDTPFLFLKKRVTKEFLKDQVGLLGNEPFFLFSRGRLLVTSEVAGQHPQRKGEQAICHTVNASSGKCSHIFRTKVVADSPPFLPLQYTLVSP